MRKSIGCIIVVLQNIHIIWNEPTKKPSRIVKPKINEKKWKMEKKKKKTTKEWQAV